MTTILALDTSGDACSCAVFHENRLYDSFDIIPRQQAAQILPMINRLMAELGLQFSALDAIAFGQGPGSFTGLRIAAGVTQGIAYAAKLPVIPVSTLSALAWQVMDKTEERTILGVIDARIDEVYWGFFSRQNGFPVLTGTEQLSKPEFILDPGADNTTTITGVGNGLAYLARFPASLQGRLQTQFPEVLPAASAIARLGLELFKVGSTQIAEEIQPVYLRDQVARKPG